MRTSFSLKLIIDSLKRSVCVTWAVLRFISIDCLRLGVKRLKGTSKELPRLWFYVNTINQPSVISKRYCWENSFISYSWRFSATRYCVKGFKCNARADDVVFVSIKVTELSRFAGNSNLTPETKWELLDHSCPRDLLILSRTARKFLSQTGNLPRLWFSTSLKLHHFPLWNL